MTSRSLASLLALVKSFECSRILFILWYEKGKSSSTSFSMRSFRHDVQLLVFFLKLISRYRIIHCAL